MADYTIIDLISFFLFLNAVLRALVDHVIWKVICHHSSHLRFYGISFTVATQGLNLLWLLSRNPSPVSNCKSLWLFYTYLAQFFSSKLRWCQREDYIRFFPVIARLPTFSSCHDLCEKLSSCHDLCDKLTMSVPSVCLNFVCTTYRFCVRLSLYLIHGFFNYKLLLILQ
jgi:hypothetical protein